MAIYNKAGFALGIIIVLIAVVTVTFGQYETPNHICGGWLRGTNGSIQFNNTPPEGQEEDPDFRQTEKVCVWTVSPMLPSQSTRFSVTVGKLGSMSCSTGSIGITFFKDRERTISNSKTWNCTSFSDVSDKWENIDGTLFVVVFKINALLPNQGFQVTWEAYPDAWYGRSGVRTMYYSNGKPSVAPIPYFAGGFFRNEIATYAFPKGNNTAGFQIEMSFEKLRLDLCNSTIDTCKTTSTFLITKIEENGTLSVDNVYDQEDNDPGIITSKWGIFLLSWVGDFWGAGGSFQLEYTSTRIPIPYDDGNILN